MLPQPGDDWLLVENDVGHYGVLEHFAHYYYRYIVQIDKLSFRFYFYERCSNFSFTVRQTDYTEEADIDIFASFTNPTPGYCIGFDASNVTKYDGT